MPIYEVRRTETICTYLHIDAPDEETAQEIADTWEQWNEGQYECETEVIIANPEELTGLSIETAGDSYIFDQDYTDYCDTKRELGETPLSFAEFTQANESMAD